MCAPQFINPGHENEFRRLLPALREDRTDLPRRIERPIRPQRPARPERPARPSDPSAPTAPTPPTAPDAPNDPSVLDRPAAPDDPSAPNSATTRLERPTRPARPARPSRPSRPFGADQDDSAQPADRPVPDHLGRLERIDYMDTPLPELPPIFGDETPRSVPTLHELPELPELPENPPLPLDGFMTLPPLRIMAGPVHIRNLNGIHLPWRDN
ncbi:hypothetical protein BGZ63DRAFT_149761 [Mariannaea sp. PMI_226]|nr:hypothetical protein BGZ63DRAFT_149761 [Mariannaea sp. PMI_226]